MANTRSALLVMCVPYLEHVLQICTDGTLPNQLSVNHMVNHMVVDMCPLTRLEDRYRLELLHYVDDDALNWLKTTATTAPVKWTPGWLYLSLMSSNDVTCSSTPVHHAVQCFITATTAPVKWTPGWPYLSLMSSNDVTCSSTPVHHAVLCFITWCLSCVAGWTQLEKVLQSAAGPATTHLASHVKNIWRWHSSLSWLRGT